MKKNRFHPTNKLILAWKKSSVRLGLAILIANAILGVLSNLYISAYITKLQSFLLAQVRNFSNPGCHSKKFASHDVIIDLLAARSYSAVKRPILVSVFFDLEEYTDASNLVKVLSKSALFKISLIEPSLIKNVTLNNTDVIIFPGGKGRLQSLAINQEGRQAVLDFVREGGGYIGICAGAFLASSQYDWSLALSNTCTLTDNQSTSSPTSRSIAVRGSGTVRIDMTNAGRKVFGGSGVPLNVHYSGGPIFTGVRDPSQYPCVSLANFGTEVVTFDNQINTMKDTPAILASRFGSGAVIIYSFHPEATVEMTANLKQAIVASARFVLD